MSKRRLEKGERGIWQRRNWEHLIRDQADFSKQLDYLHYNPVKHGYVNNVKDCPYSTFSRGVDEGLYSGDWGNQGGGIYAGDWWGS